MSQIAPRVVALVTAPLSGAGMVSTSTSASVAAAAMPAAVDEPRDDAKPASMAPEATATQVLPETSNAIGDATAANAAPAPAVGTIATNANGAATSSATAAPAPATTAAAAKQPVTTTAHVGTAATLPQSPATAGSLGGAFFALVLVLGLILALAWLAKRLPGVAGSSNPALRVVGSLSLGPRERVVVVAIGDTQLLLGVGAGGTRTLHTLTEPLPVAASTTPAFAQLLAQHFGKKA